MSEQQDALDIQTLWQEVNTLLRQGPVNRPLWDAVQAAAPLALEGDTLVLGLTPQDMRHASYLETDVNRSRLRQVMHARTGRNLDLRVIEGATPEDWQRVQQRESAAVERVAGRLREARTFRTASTVWEEAGGELTALFSGAKGRAYPTVKARLLAKSLPLIAKAEQQARQNEPGGDDQHQRYLNRLLERVATSTDLAPTAVAVEYLRFTARRGAEPEPGS